MSKYRIIQNGYGFRGRYWEVGTVVEIDPSEQPPKYFQLVEAQTGPAQEPTPQPSEVQTPSQRRGRKRK